MLVSQTASDLRLTRQDVNLSRSFPQTCSRSLTGRNISITFILYDNQLRGRQSNAAGKLIASEQHLEEAGSTTMEPG